MHLKIPWNQPLRLLKCAATPSGSKHTETAGLGRTCSPLTSLTDRWLERQRVSTHDSPINIHGHGNSVLTFTVKSQHECIHCHPLTRGHACYIQGCRFSERLWYKTWKIVAMGVIRHRVSSATIHDRASRQTETRTTRQTECVQFICEVCTRLCTRVKYLAVFRFLD